MLAHAPHAFKNRACHFRNEGLAATKVCAGVPDKAC